jgi:hypothetical protein
MEHRQDPRRQKVLQQIQLFDAKIDVCVGTRKIAHLNTEARGGFICRAVGLPGCSIRPFALILALLGAGPKALRR